MRFEILKLRTFGQRATAASPEINSNQRVMTRDVSVCTFTTEPIL